MDAKTQDAILRWFVDNGRGSTLMEYEVVKMFRVSKDEAEELGEIGSRINAVWDSTFSGTKESLTLMRNLDRIKAFLEKGGGGVMAIEDSVRPQLNVNSGNNLTFNGDGNNSQIGDRNRNDQNTEVDTGKKKL